MKIVSLISIISLVLLPYDLYDNGIFFSIVALLPSIFISAITFNWNKNISDIIIDSVLGEKTTLYFLGGVGVFLGINIMSVLLAVLYCKGFNAGYITVVIAMGQFIITFANAIVNCDEIVEKCKEVKNCI